MSSSKLQKKRIASIIRYARRKLWLDANYVNMSNTNVRSIVRKLLKNEIMFKRLSDHSRNCIRKHIEIRRMRRQCAFGRRRGAAHARIQRRDLWGQRQRLKVLKRNLKKDKDDTIIDKRLYHCLYLKLKENVVKHKRLIMEYINEKKMEKAKMKSLHDQNEAKRLQAKESRKRRKQRLAIKEQEMIYNFIKENKDAAAKK